MATIVPKLAERPPKFVDSPNLTEFVKSGTYSVKSQTVNYDDDSPAALFSVPPNTQVIDLIINVTAAFDGTGAALAIGDGDDADGFMDATAAAVATVGWKSIKQDTQPYSGGKIYTAADTIDATITPGTSPTAGTFVAYLVYRSFTDE